MRKFYEIVFASSDCAKGFDSLPKSIREAYEKWETKNLALDPHNACNGTLTYGELLFKNYPKPIYKKRFGDYRIVYVVKDIVGDKGPGYVIILRVGHRRDIYSSKS